ncbi:MAG: hypothetical protein U1E26_03065 [Coriobacteriia bacterium]|nr:hypothetical protein [Coriobacteriia bacterium]
MRSGMRRFTVLTVLAVAFALAGATQAFAFFEDPRVNGGARVDADDIGSAVYVPSGVRGSFVSPSDSDDVVRVRLFKGEDVYVFLARQAGTGTNVFLYGPGTTTVVGNDDGIVAEGEALTDDPDLLIFSYRIPETGYYYIDVWHPSGGASGGYDLRYTSEWGDDRDLPPGVALPTSGVVPGLLDQVYDLDDVFKVPLKAGDNFTAKITDADGWPGIDFDLFLYKPGAPDVSPASDSYLAKEAKTALTVGERLSFVAPTAGAYSLDVFAQAAGGDYELKYSTLTAPAGPTKAAYCYLSPRVTAGTKPVSFEVYKKVGSTYKFYKSYPGKAVNAGTRSKCVASFTLSPKHKWRVRSKTSSHGLGTRYSGYVSVTFK